MDEATMMALMQQMQQHPGGMMAAMEEMAHLTPDQLLQRRRGGAASTAEDPVLKGLLDPIRAHKQTGGDRLRRATMLAPWQLIARL